MCWGDAGGGILGDGVTVTNETPTYQTTPIDVSGISSGVAAIANGYMHACAVTTAGTALCWGSNPFGNLGDGPRDGRRRGPTGVSGLSSGVAAIAAGWGHTCAVTTLGAALCWGYNVSSALGDGTGGHSANGVEVTSLTPVGVIGLSSGVAAIAAGSEHTCALTTAGSIKCWGWNSGGQLGDGTLTNRTTPVDVR